MSWTRNIRHSIAKLFLTACVIAALSVAANAFRYFLQNEALAAIEATEQASYTGSPTLRVHVELPTATENAAAVPNNTPTQTRFVDLPAGPDNGLHPSKVKVPSPRLNAEAI